MRSVLFFLWFFTISLQAQNLKIAAAADLRYAMDEIVQLFRLLHPGANIDVIYGSSGNTYTQISNGAPYDLYFSADIMYPRMLHQAGLTSTKPELYAIGRIVLWSSTLDVSKGMNVLIENPRTRIAIANPDHAPYGKRAMESLQYYKLLDKVKKRLVHGENISQAAQFCLTGNAGVGILALSLVLAPAMSDKGTYFLIDEASHNPLEQGFVILSRAKDNPLAAEFARYIVSMPTRLILEKYGFALP